MTNIFPLLSKYNRHVNDKLFALLRTVPEALIFESMGSFFTSIIGLLNHVLVSDLLWLNRYRKSGVSFLSLQHTALDFIYKGFNVLLFKDLPELQNRREQVDRVFSDFSEELTDPILENEFVYTNTSGEEFRRVFWQVLLHVFNHQTHHRGQISQILDSHGVEHDFSNLNALLS